MKRGLLLIAVGVLLVVIAGCGSASNGGNGKTTSHLTAAQVRARHSAKRKIRHEVRKHRAKARHRAKIRARKEAKRRRVRRHHRHEVRQEHRVEREQRQLALAEDREQRQAERAEAESTEESECDPNYTGACLMPNVSDYDCAGGEGNGPYYTGEVTVVGVDHYGLDEDNDGIGCESG